MQKSNLKFEYFLGVASVVIFVVGFFPITHLTTEFHNKPPTQLSNVSLAKDKHYISNISKTVIVIIDALRLDFTNPKYMPLTATIAKNHGCFIQVSVEIPTVTLPRIKSLTTGSVPQFMDIVLNLANTKALKDSLIHSAKNHQKRIAFYGDETWLKLFPNEFNRCEGTNSFFVKDFTEVDDNVTRNLNQELQREDWDILILHYLGLDHIGHVHGPFSSLVPIKLKEMDEIIYRIYQTLSHQHENILLAVTADHGMRDSGGHGGSSYGETKVPLFLVGLDCHNCSLQQSDIPVNLAVLLGLNIPSTAIGQVHPGILNFNLEKYLYVLRYNLLLLKQKSVICDEDFDLASQLHLNYLQSKEEKLGLEAAELYSNCSNIISENLMKASVRQEIGSLTIAILLLLNVLFILIANIFIVDYSATIISKFLLLPLSLLYLLSSSIFLFITILTFLSLTVSILRVKLNNCKFQNKYLFIMFLQPLTFVSSSFVEEEHQYWYFVNSLLILCQILHHSSQQNFKLSICCILISIYIRLIRRLNSTGDQWANYPDLSDWFLKPENNLYHISFLIICMIVLYISIVNLVKMNTNIKIYQIITLGCIFIFKTTDAILLGQISWIFILTFFIVFFKNYKVITWILVGTLLLRSYNIVLIPFCIFYHLSIKKFIQNSEMFVLSHIWLGNMLFFAQGHSNSLASVDVSVGYTGLYSYQPYIVVLQVLLHTYIFPVLCCTLVLRNIPRNSIKVWNIIFCNRFYIFLIIATVTFLLRHHLFIWSVFAPKLFIEFIHVLFIFLVYCCFLFIRTVEKYLFNNKLLK